MYKIEGTCSDLLLLVKPFCLQSSIKSMYQYIKEGAQFTFLSGYISWCIAVVELLEPAQYKICTDNYRSSSAKIVRQQFEPAKRSIISPIRWLQLKWSRLTSLVLKVVIISVFKHNKYCINWFELQTKRCINDLTFHSSKIPSLVWELSTCRSKKRSNSDTV
jgi:hypothetical protein